jgi:Response regulator containing CheY-like receiver domain and AraC-type DNA-binding domain
VYKIIFVDDEISTLKFLTNALDWEEYGIEIVGTANDGKEGIDLYRKTKPDIIIVDIKMPSMNGIDFSAIVREVDKRVKIIILSAYGEFQYAQSALRLQIKDYLLKPLDEERLDDVIRKLLVELEDDYELEKELCEKKLQHLLMTDSGSDVFQSFFKEHKNEFYECNRVISILVTNVSLQDNDYSIYNIIRQSSKELFGRSCIVVMKSKRKIFIVLEAEIFQTKKDQLLERFHHDGIEFCMGISRVVTNENLIQGLWQADMSRYYCFFSEKTVQYYHDNIHFITNDISNLSYTQKDLITSISKMEYKNLFEKLQCDLKELYNQYLHPDCIYEFVLDMLINIKIEFTKNLGEYSIELLRHISRDSLISYWNKHILMEYLQSIFLDLQHEVSKICNEQQEYFVLRYAKQLTEEKYSDSKFTLQEVADYVGISKNHFSKIFRDMEGKTYWDYLTEYRMKQAKLLLNNSLKSINEISNEVGYESVNHFSRKFKEMEGVSPLQYRKGV